VPIRRRARASSSAARPVPYNPLEKSELARSVETALLATEPRPLSQVPEFYGVGIYVLYYGGSLALYEPIAGTSTPIYVGKAVPRGSRKALTDEAAIGKELWERISEHRESTVHAVDLSPADFMVRYLVADDVFIPLAERLMIRTAAPVWNVVVDGFGNHDPGGGRYNQRVSPWDALHPGRPWVPRLTRPCKFSREEIVVKVGEHFVAHPPVAMEAKLPPAGPVTPLEDSEVAEIADEDE
jgi:hypothetical protein